MRILIFTNIPSPYRVDFFNELGKHCDLTVVFERQFSKRRDDSWAQYQFKTFNGIFLSGIKLKGSKAFCPSVVKQIKKNVYDHIIVMNYANPTGWMEILTLKFKRIPYMIEGDGAVPSETESIVSIIKDKVKRYLLSNAYGYFSTSANHDEYYLKYGVDANKIYRYSFSSLKESDILPSPLTDEEKWVRRQELSIPYGKVLISVGQFVYRKGFDVLLKSANKIDRSIGIYIVGGTPTSEMVQYIKEYGLDNVHFLDFQIPSVLKKYFQASDMFVLPTRSDVWGLVINEAMSNGLPIISTNKCVAALELVENGENGYIVPVDDAIELANRINDLFSNSSTYYMAKKSLERIRVYTIENMVREHIKILERM